MPGDTGVAHEAQGKERPLQAHPSEDVVLRKVTLRLIPFLVLLYLVAFLDRVNVGFAALTMNDAIGLSATAFGLGAGIFFIGYFLFELPSNLLLKRYGARKWIARIIVSWGLVSIGMAFVTGPVSFWVMRFLLGVAEAGFFPGMVLYLTYWFPNRVRGAVIGLFIIANPVATIIGAPLSTSLLGTNMFDLAGWQTMFIVEGLPAVILGIVAFFKLSDSPAQASWLSASEKQVLLKAVESDQQTSRHVSLRAGLVSADVWRLTLVYAGLMIGVYGFGFWAPQIIKSFGGLTNQQVGWILVIPYVCATVAMCLWGRHSDRSGERVWHLALPAPVAGAGFLYGSFSGNLHVSIFAFTLGAMGIYATLPVFWTLPTALLSGTAAAGGIAVINSFGNLSGYLGPVAIGWLKESTQGYAAGLSVIGFAMIFAGVFGLYAAHRCSKA
jgi:ACS family tartrate transporter-like MFS transporter